MIAAKTMSMVLAPCFCPQELHASAWGKLPRELVTAITLGKRATKSAWSRQYSVRLGRPQVRRRSEVSRACVVKRASLGSGRPGALGLFEVEEYHCPRQTRQQGNRGSPPQSTYAVRSTIHVASIVSGSGACGEQTQSMAQFVSQADRHGDAGYSDEANRFSEHIRHRPARSGWDQVRASGIRNRQDWTQGDRHRWSRSGIR
jgi:hypothetical protein